MPNVVDAMPDTPPDAVDAAIDSPPDSSAIIKYDVGYINELTMGPGFSSVLNFLVVVNKGTEPLHTPELSVESVTDDNPDVAWEFAKTRDAGAPLASGHAAGALSAAAKSRLVDSGLVPEPIDDTALSFRLSFPSGPPAGTTINGSATIRIDGKDAVLPFVIRIVANGTVDFDNVRRVSSKP